MLRLRRQTKPGWLAASLGLLTACLHLEPSPGPSLASQLPESRVMFIGAHPDDETLVGPILARSCVALGRPCRLVIMTRGEGGACARAGGCPPDLGTVRTREMKRAADAYAAELHIYAHPNAPLPWSSFPNVEETRARWSSDRDPLQTLIAEIREFRPTVLLTFDPVSGFTGHPEHELVARLALEAVLASAGPEHPRLGQPHAVGAFYEVLSQHWLARWFGRSDESMATETHDADTDCRPVRPSCLELALEITRVHQSQARDMGSVRQLGRLMRTMYLRRVTNPEGELERVLSASSASP